MLKMVRGTPRRPTWVRLAGVGLAVAIGVAACGGDDDEA